MLIIGQDINIFSAGVFNAVNDKDKGLIKRLAEEQLSLGAKALEINLGGWRTSHSALPWLVSVVREITPCPLFLSPIPATLKDALQRAGTNTFINCVPADRDRLESMLSAAMCLGAGVVVLLVKEGYCPSTLDQVCLLAEEVIETAEERDFPLDRLYVDPVLRPRISATSSGDMANMPDVSFFAECIYLLKRLRQKGPKTLVAMSSLTLGMPKGRRRMYEASALDIFKQAGLDAAIVDVSNHLLMERLSAPEADKELDGVESAAVSSALSLVI